MAHKKLVYINIDGFSFSYLERLSGWLPALTKRWLFIHRPAQRVGVHHESHAKCYLVRRLERKDP